MELKWVKIGSEGAKPMLVARSNHDERNRYEISGTEGFWYGMYHDNSKPNTSGFGFNLGWSPSLELMKSHCQDIDEYLSL
jgi:hypothetical protein